jgi:hypothetical protein
MSAFSHKQTLGDHPLIALVFSFTSREGKMLDRFHKMAEIIASIAIVGSLIFVGIQVNQNTDATRASNAQVAMQVWSDHAMAMATSESLAHTYMDGIHPELLEIANLTVNEVRINMWWSASVRSVESNYLEWLAGNVSDELWFSHRQTLLSSYVTSLGMQSYWASQAENHSQPFRELMKEISTEAAIRFEEFRAFRDANTG